MYSKSSQNSSEANFNKRDARRERRAKAVMKTLAVLTVPSVGAYLAQDKILEGALGPPDSIYTLKSSSNVLPSESKATSEGTELCAGSTVSITTEIDPMYTRTPLDPRKISVRIDGSKFDLYKISDKPFYQTADGSTEFLIRDIAKAQTLEGIRGDYNVSIGLNKTTKLELHNGAFLIPSPLIDVEALIRSGFFEKHNLEFLGVAASGYVKNAPKRGEERRVGFAYVRGEGIAFNTLGQNTRIGRGYYVRDDGKMKFLDLSPNTADKRLEDLMKDPHVLAISVCNHNEVGKKEVSFAGKHYRAPFACYDRKDDFLGILYTTEATGDEERARLVHRAFPQAVNFCQYDGDFFSKRIVWGAEDPQNQNVIATTFYHAQLVVKLRHSNELMDHTQQLMDCKAGKKILRSEKLADLLGDSRDPDKISQKLGEKIPKSLKWAAGDGTWLMKKVSNWASNNPFVRGWMIRKVMENEPKE